MPKHGVSRVIVLTAIFTVVFFALCSIISVVGVVSGVFPDTLASRTIEERYTEQRGATRTAEKHVTQTTRAATVTPSITATPNTPTPPATPTPSAISTP